MTQFPAVNILQGKQLRVTSRMKSVSSQEHKLVQLYSGGTWSRGRHSSNIKLQDS